MRNTMGIAVLVLTLLSVCTPCPGQPMRQSGVLLEKPAVLTVEQAIERLLRDNLTLRIRRQNLARAEADVLVDGKRNNPFLYGAATNVPYGGYSPQRPGPLAYETTITQPVDVNGKRRRRLEAAYRARDVVGALYQNAIRMEVERLYDAFLDVLAYQVLLEERRLELKSLDADLQRLQHDVPERRRLATAELDEALAERARMVLHLESLTSQLQQARQTLGEVLNASVEETRCLEVTGQLDAADKVAPCLEELIELALEARPDLAAYRLGVRQTAAEIDEELAERWFDVYVLFSPFTYEDNSPQGLQSTSSWSLEGLFMLPLFSRNQGEIARARITNRQVKIDLQGRQREVIAEVQRVHERYASTAAALRRYRQEILPRAARVRDALLRRVVEDQEDARAYLEAQEEYRLFYRRYLDALFRHQYAAFRLNIAVGQRLDF